MDSNQSGAVGGTTRAPFQGSWPIWGPQEGSKARCRFRGGPTRALPESNSCLQVRIVGGGGGGGPTGDNVTFFFIGHFPSISI